MHTNIVTTEICARRSKELPGVLFPKPSDIRAMKKPGKGSEKSRAPDESAQQGELPVDYMLRVMRDPKAPQARRDTMAKSATPYIHARPPPKKKRSRGDAALKKRLEKARETLAGKIAGLRSDCD
jgi:hypothetical protein